MGFFKVVNLKNIKNLVLSIVLPVAVGLLARAFTRNSSGIYSALLKPVLAPPAWVFGVVWPVLYVLMGIAAFLVMQAVTFDTQKSRAMWLYYIQLIVNFFWPLIFFNLQMYGFAFLWLLILLLLVIMTALAFYNVRRIAGWLLVAYIAWLSFAGYLNYMVWMLN